MAEIPVSDEEMALRRRARRRLVGAVALALTAIVVLPMLFDPQAKPLGPEVDVQIPAQDTPFKPAQAPAAPAMTAKPADVVEPAASVLNPVETVPSAQVPPPAPVATKPAEPTAPVPPSNAKKPVLAEEPSKTAEKPAGPAAKQVAKGYMLQLGVFDKKANAEKMIERARAAGFKAQVSGAQGRWRVLIGPLAEHGKAEDLAAKLKSKGLEAVLVAP